MPTLRLHPLLIAGAACLTLAACGSDDDPPASQAKAPATTGSERTATTTAPDSAPEPTEAPDTPGSTTATEPSSPRSSDGADSTKAPRGNADETPSSTDDTSSTATETVKIRESLVALQEAFAAKDGAKACSYMLGVPKKTDPKAPGMSCESLSEGPKAPLSEQNRTAAATAKVTVNGNDATAELGPGVPFKLRKVNGRWRVDYSEMINRSAAGSR